MDAHHNFGVHYTIPDAVCRPQVRCLTSHGRQLVTIQISDSVTLYFNNPKDLESLIDAAVQARDALTKQPEGAA